ncbi:MAG: flagellar export chaperone FliS [Pseudomonadota bacterium]
MQVASRTVINAYSQVGIETGVNFASPHQLVLLLFDGALSAIANAKLHMSRKEIAAKGEAISKAISIIDAGLKASLDDHAGDQIAQNLKALYEYMGKRLLWANMKNSADALDEVTGLLLELKGAWEAIGKQNAPQPEPTNLQNRVASSYGRI